MQPLRVAVVTNLLPHYRSAFYRRLFQREDLIVRVFCQATTPGLTLELSHDDFPGQVTVVPAMCLKDERLGWQSLPWRKLLSSYDVLFVNGNPRVVSNVVLASLARAAGKPVVIWGQVHTAGGGGVAKRLRLSWYRSFDNLFVYTDAEARWLQDRGFRRQHVLGMNNGLDQRRIDQAAAAWGDEGLGAWRARLGLERSELVLSCARLEAKNRFDLWLAAMPAVIERHPNLLWCVIGDGSERQALEARARESGLSNHIRWLGAILDEDDLAPWFLSSRLLVHPGAIGLTLLHAFGYGLPVVTHDDGEAHMPEFGAFVPGETGLVYRRGDARHLAEVVSRGLSDESGLRCMKARALPVAREQYNVDVMVERFASMARHAVEN